MQIEEIYCRRRDERGGLRPPKRAAEGPLSLEQELAAAAAAMAGLGVAPEEQQKGLEKIRAAHAAKNGGQ